MRALALSLVLAATGLAGCLDTADLPSGLDPASTMPAFPTLPADLTPFTALVCAGDEVVPLAGAREADCNYAASAESGPATEVHVAVNPLDPMNLVAGSKDFTLGEDTKCGKYNVWSGVHTSFDAGRSWTHSLLPGYPGDTRETALSAYSCGSDPVLIFGPTGVVYYVSIHYTAGVADDGVPWPAQLGPFVGPPSVNGALAVTRSDDGGKTWNDPVLLATKDDGSILDKEWAAVDMATGALYVSFIDTGNGEFFVQRSDDLGATWTAPMLVPTWAPSDQEGPTGGQFGQIAVTPDGVLHFTYWGEGGPELSGIYHLASSDGGATWSDRHLVAHYYPIFNLEFTHKYRIVPNPALAADPTNGNLYVAYPWYADPGAGAPGGNLDALVAASTDGGKTWSAPVRVNDDMTAPANGQWMQALAVGNDGTVHTTWLDYREDPSGQSARVYYAYSQDVGKTWSANVPVSDVLFDGTGGYHQTGAGTIGDYMGLAVSDHAVYPFWSDTRDGRNDAFSAIILA